MLLRYHITICICIFAGCFTIAQNKEHTFQMLVKRYGNVTPWGKGYIVKANGFYGFSDTCGRFVWPIENFKFDTLLNNRACVAGRNTYLVDENGKIIKTRGFPYILINRKRRLLAECWSPESAWMCNDKGEGIGAQFDPRMPKDSWILLRKHMGKHSFDYLEGIITVNGDTILPQVFQRIEMGPRVIACLKGDTAFIYDYNGKLLSYFAKVNSCRVLSNNLLVLEKYRAAAIANPDGRLLTPFHYIHIDDYGYSTSSLPEDNKEKVDEKEPLCRLAYVRVQSPYPSSILLDTSIKKVADYNHIESNRNSGYFDVLLKTIVKLPEKTKPAKPEAAAPPSSSEHDIIRKKQELVGKQMGDTIAINVAGSKAIRKNSHWGIISITGDSILPFDYDSLYYYDFNYPYPFFACRQGKFALLDWEGQAATPAVFEKLQPQEMIGILPDSIATKGISQLTYFSYKGGKLRQIDPYKEPVPPTGYTFKNGMAYINGFWGFKPGIYNRRMQFLAKFPYPHNYWDERNLTSTGLTIISDSLKTQITIIDSTGRQLIPRFSTNGSWIDLHDRYALVMVEGETSWSLLYRFQKEKIRLDTVWWDETTRGAFKIKGYAGIGIYGFDTIVTIPDADEVIFDGNLVRFRINKKWGMCTKTGELLLPSNYDEPPTPAGNYNQFNWRQLLIRQQGKVGVYDYLVRKWVAPDHDSIYYYYDQSYTHFYLITKSRNGSYWFINDDGQSMTRKGWDLNKNYKIHQNMYPGSLCGFPVSRNGTSYRLYPTLGDSLEIVPDLSFITGQVIWISSEGIAIVQKDSLLGLYNTVQNVWLIPLSHNRLERDWDKGWFFVYNVTPPGISFFDATGKPLFTTNGTYNKVRRAIGDQWSLNDGSPPIINSKGTIIVPDTFTRFRYGIHEERTPLRGFYRMLTKQGKWMFIDTSGKVILAPIQNEPEYIYTNQGNFIYSINDKYGLVNPQGKLLVYNKITECRAASISISARSATLHVWKYEKAKEVCFVVSEGQPEKFGLLDRYGNTLIPCLYDGIYPLLINNNVLVKKGKLWGLVSLKNKPVTGFIYETIIMEEEGETERLMRGM